MAVRPWFVNEPCEETGLGFPGNVGSSPVERISSTVFGVVTASGRARLLVSTLWLAKQSGQLAVAMVQRPLKRGIALIVFCVRVGVMID